ncbi:MAG: DUF2612 domain-containing protein [Opitutaceae bacterium]|jgi:hypothetical protein|nr:DUF2612 domain-containing protein [Opitutaceae bacterium]
MTSEQITDYYTDLLILQYRLKPRARATIAAFVRQAVADRAALLLNSAFDLDTATGRQLDTIAKYIGVPREYNYQATRDYFCFADAADIPHENGFADYLDPTANQHAIFYQYGYSDQSTGTLTDARLLLLIKLKIARNKSDSTLAGIMADMNRVFKGAVDVVDNRDMTLVFKVDSALVDVPLELIEPILPRPAGVGIGVTDWISRFRLGNYANTDSTRRGLRRYEGDPTGSAVIDYETTPSST